MNWILIIMAAGLIIGLFMGILLLTLDRGNRRANRLLGALMILSSICIGDFALSRLDYYNQLPHLIGIAPAMLFLIGPLYYSYVKMLTRPGAPLKGKALFHFLPFALLLLYRLPFFIKPAGLKLYIFQNDDFYDTEHKTIIIIQTIHILVYLFMVYRVSPKYDRKKDKLTPEQGKASLRWIRQGLNFFLVLTGFIVLYFALLLSGIDLHPLYSAFIPLMISFTVLWMGFTGLRQPIIFPSEGPIVKLRKYEKSTLTAEQADLYLNELTALMEKEKLYLDGDLTLQKLADRMSVLPNHLSQVINDRRGQNFYDFVNSYRIKTAQRLLLEPEGRLLTISAIALEAGFNSKSSFNSAFKKLTGKTPSEFRDEEAL